MYWIAVVFAAGALVTCGSAESAEYELPAEPANPVTAAIGRASDHLVLVPCHGERGNLCYDDADGVSQFWVDTVQMEIYSAEVRSRQERYNLWVRGARAWAPGVSIVEAPLSYQHYRPPLRTLSGTTVSMPQSIRTTGRLDLDTIAIPLYRAVHRLSDAHIRFEVDCQRDYGIDYDSMTLCSRIGITVMHNSGESPLALAEMQRFPDDFRLRVTTLTVAFERSHQLAEALKAVLDSAGKTPEELIMDGVNPDELAPEKLEAMDTADVLLAAALDEVDWAAELYKPIQKP